MYSNTLDPHRLYQKSKGKKRKIKKECVAKKDQNLGPQHFQKLHLDPNVGCAVAIPLYDCLVLCNTLTQEQTAIGS